MAGKFRRAQGDPRPPSHCCYARLRQPVPSAPSSPHPTRFSKSIQERFGYRYDDKELKKWAGNVKRLAEDAAETHVVFNNCYRDYAQVNAKQLEALFAA